MLVNPKLINAITMENLNQTQKEALQKASLIDDDMQEMIDNQPELLNLDNIIRQYLNPLDAGGNSGDANGDGKVDGLDYVIWLNNYNKTVTAGAASGDFDLNGKVDGLDYVIWLNNYNKIYPTPTVSPAATLVPTLTPTQIPSLTPTPSIKPTGVKTPTPSPQNNPLNIVLILSDDQRYDSLSKMPFMGSRIGWHKFTRAYSNVALCCPSRATILSGQYSHNTGVEDNLLMEYFNEKDNLATRLHDKGYTTGLIGKYLNGWFYKTGVKKIYTPPGWDLWNPFIQVNYFNYSLVENGVEKYYGQNEADYSTDVVGHKALNFINTVKEPFYLHFAPYAAHGPWIPAPRHAATNVNPIIFDPSFNEQDVSDKPLWVQQLPLYDVNKMTEVRRTQYRMLLSLDEWIKKIILALQTRNILDRTIIIYMTDNALSDADHRIVEKVCPYNSCNRLPLLIRYPFKPGRDINTLISNTDIAPTIAELAGVQLLNPDGLSLVSLLNGQNTLNRRGILIHWGNTHKVWMIPAFWGIVKNQWKYIELETGEKELYDLSFDPYELTNVANQSQYRQIQAGLATDLATLKPVIIQPL
ncbi:hypothetical protein A2W14_02515 [Candidatus Gottesmanbacteria bacterium RBG_16_37_8]|uniref:Sulfatase N-terminal domain-containing protein n=1 Tax=Candidatus Gottesmanbacteria bacterium RBG_16_37_8 TaxID=1798371 RepID=A0A1F5YQP4_9BACT|nr:MAG: hypothetical protein A2W14_02515 [Candidatus Gottesmanbacteria bacterium RBG_16_37_8]